MGRPLSFPVKLEPESRIGVDGVLLEGQAGVVKEWRARGIPSVETELGVAGVNSKMR